MENSNRNDVIQFFKDMPRDMQIEAINKMQRQAKKPPDVSLQPNYKNEGVSATHEYQWENVKIGNPVDYDLKKAKIPYPSFRNTHEIKSNSKELTEATDTNVGR